MIEPIPGASGNTLGFKVTGHVAKEDYTALEPAVAAAVEEFGSVRLLLDLVGFRWEKVDAWGADLRFGRTYRDHVYKMAIVGDRIWEKYLAGLAEPCYAREARFFDSDVEAWDWLRL